jgi:hypothetical protein
MYHSKNAITINKLDNTKNNTSKNKSSTVDDNEPVPSFIKAL